MKFSKLTIVAILALTLGCSYAFGAVKNDDKSTESKSKKTGWIGIVVNDAVPQGGSPFDLRNAVFGLKLGFNLTRNFYVEDEVKWEEKAKLSNITTLGFQLGNEFSTTYVEGSYDMQRHKIHYAGGLKLPLGNTVTPYIEADDFLDKEKRSFLVGAQVKLSHRIQFDVDYNITDRKPGHAYRFEIDYIF